MQKVLWGLAIAGAVYAAICLILYLVQRRLVYFPDAELVATPADVGLRFRDVTLRASDGVPLHAWFVPGDPGDLAILFCHGNAGNISHRLDSIRILNRLGASVLIFDYRGYGRSGGEISEPGTYRDSRAAWEYLTGELGFGPARIVLLGRSLGAAVAVELAADRDPGGLIVESGFPSLPEVGALVYPWLPVKLLSRIRYDSRSRVKAIGVPKLFVHARGDEIVPLALGRRLFEEAAPPRRFLEIDGNHNDGFLVSEPEYVAGLAGFLDQVRRRPRGQVE